MQPKVYHLPRDVPRIMEYLRIPPKTLRTLVVVGTLPDTDRDYLDDDEEAPYLAYYKGRVGADDDALRVMSRALAESPYTNALEFQKLDVSLTALKALKNALCANRRLRDFSMNCPLVREEDGRWYCSFARMNDQLLDGVCCTENALIIFNRENLRAYRWYTPPSCPFT